MAAHVLHVFSTFAAGGPQVRTARLLAGLGPAWRHGVLALDGVTDARTILPEGIDVTVLEPLRRAGTWTTVRGVRALARRLSPDLVCTYNWGAIEAVWAARSLGLAVLHHEDGFRPDELGGFKRRRVWARRLSLRRVQGVVVPSHTLRTIARERWHLPPERLHLVPNGIELARFPRADGNPALRERLAIPPGAFVVGSVGHLRAEKRPARLVRALAHMQEPAHLLFVGDGPERESVTAAARALGLEARLHLAGHQTETAPWYRLMDAFAIPSDTEQMPVALLEAMASGLPVAATDVGDVRRVLPEAAGAHVVALGAGVDERLAAALDALARSPQTRATLARAGALRVRERYTQDEMVRAYERLYTRAAGLSTPAGNAAGPARS